MIMFVSILMNGGMKKHGIRETWIGSVLTENANELKAVIRWNRNMLDGAEDATAFRNI